MSTSRYSNWQKISAKDQGDRAFNAFALNLVREEVFAAIELQVGKYLDEYFSFFILNVAKKVDCSNTWAAIKKNLLELKESDSEKLQDILGPLLQEISVLQTKRDQEINADNYQKFLDKMIDMGMLGSDIDLAMLAKYFLTNLVVITDNGPQPINWNSDRPKPDIVVFFDGTDYASFEPPVTEKKNTDKRDLIYADIFTMIDVMKRAVKDMQATAERLLAIEFVDETEFKSESNILSAQEVRELLNPELKQESLSGQELQEWDSKSKVEPMLPSEPCSVPESESQKISNLQQGLSHNFFKPKDDIDTILTFMFHYKDFFAALIGDKSKDWRTYHRNDLEPLLNDLKEMLEDEKFQNTIVGPNSLAGVDKIPGGNMAPLRTYLENKKDLVDKLVKLAKNAENENSIFNIWRKDHAPKITSPG